MNGGLPRALVPYAALVGLLGALFLFACESDPVLSPQGGDDEEDGSYGRSNLQSGPLVPNPETF